MKVEHNESKKNVKRASNINLQQNDTLKIYIASSFRNLHAVELLRDKLQDLGHTVLDFTKFTPPLPL